MCIRDRGSGECVGAALSVAWGWEADGGQTLEHTPHSTAHAWCKRTAARCMQLPEVATRGACRER
eukprot:2232404-Alexandrium_andersonii.AAC.1